MGLDPIEKTFAAADQSAPLTPMPLGAIGNYRLIRRLGEGGMGMVFEAEQQNPRRPVALKLIHGGRFASPYAVRLFEREVQALARLKHPGIAAIYDAGRTDDERHFFTMELAGGQTLDAFLAAHPLGTRPLLELFLKLADAVTYAHQRGVIHRDLKPANIMVQEETGGYSLKILDFGLARIHDDAERSGPTVTTAGSVHGTLAYMSPEQASGNPDEIDLRTDVYSLGVILYEALAGRRPLTFEKQTLPEIARVIREAEPPALQKLVPAIDEDLATIVHKALAKDPGQRYSSVAALADDITRYLANQPIQARPLSTVYQLRKLVARHRLGFAFAAMTLVLLAGFAVALSFQNTRIVRERDRANQEAATAMEVSGFLTRLFSIVNPSESQGNRVTARELLDQGAARVSQELRSQPRVRASLLQTMSEAYAGLGLYTKAEGLGAEALALREKEHGPRSLEVAESLRGLATLAYNRGEYALCSRYERQALEIRRALLGNEHPAVAQSLASLGGVLSKEGRFEEAIGILRESHAAAARLQGPESAEALQAMIELATAYSDASNFPAAEPLFRQTLAAYERIHGPTSQQVIRTLNNLGNLLSRRGDDQAAEPVKRRCVAGVEKIYGPDHANTALTRQNLAATLRALGQWDEAERLTRSGLAIFDKALGRNHPRRSIFLTGLGDILLDRGDFEGAGRLYRESLDFDRKHPNPNRFHLALSYERVGDLLLRQGSAKEAEPLLREGLELSQKLLPAPSPDLARNRLQLGLCLLRLQRVEEARPLLEQSRAALEAALGAAHPDTRRAAAALVTAGSAR